MITKEVDVQTLRDGNVILIGEWAGKGGFKARVHRVKKYDDGMGDELYEVLFSSLERPLLELDQITYVKGHKMTLVF